MPQGLDYPISGLVSLRTLCQEAGGYQVRAGAKPTARGMMAGKSWAVGGEVSFGSYHLQPSPTPLLSLPACLPGQAQHGERAGRYAAPRCARRHRRSAERLGHAAGGRPACQVRTGEGEEGIWL